MSCSVEIKKFKDGVKIVEAIDGSGANGQIKKASFFGRNIKVLIGNKDIELNRGSLISYLEAHPLDGIKPIFDRGGLLFSSGDDDAALQLYLDSVVNSLPEENDLPQEMKPLLKQEESGIAPEVHYHFAIKSIKEHDEEMYLHHIEKAADLGYVDAFVKAGEAFMKLGNKNREIAPEENENYKKAFKYFVSAANHGIPAGHHQLAFCYMQGMGVAKNLNKYFEHFRKFRESL